jgi:uncharacterized membrane protein YraQ (UPF0718 family)
MKLKPLWLALILFLGWWIAYLLLPSAVDTLVYGIINLEKGTHFASAIYFFIYDTPKVLLLLTLIVFFVGILRSYFSPEKTRKILENKPLLLGNVLASMLGIVTPFCSCSAVPLFIGFVEAGIPLGVTFSFLIAAPMINEIAIVLLFGLFGWKVTLLYITTGLCISILAGFIINKLKVERYVEGWVYQIKSHKIEVQSDKLILDQRIVILCQKSGCT